MGQRAIRSWISRHSYHSAEQTVKNKKLDHRVTNYWNYVNPEAQTLGNEAITMAIGSPERNAKLRRFQEIVNGDIGLVPLFTQFDNLVMREHVQDYVYYPDAIPVLAKLSLG
jgi:hypothetical protein